MADADNNALDEKKPNKNARTMVIFKSAPSLFKKISPMSTIKKTIGKNSNADVDDHDEMCTDSNFCYKVMTQNNNNKNNESGSLLDELPDDAIREATLRRKLKIEALKKTSKELKINNKLILQTSDDLDITLKNL